MVCLEGLGIVRKSRWYASAERNNVPSLAAFLLFTGISNFRLIGVSQVLDTNTSNEPVDLSEIEWIQLNTILEKRR